MYTVTRYNKHSTATSETPMTLEQAIWTVKQHAKERGHAYDALKREGTASHMEFWAVSADEKSRELMAEIDEV